MKNLFKFVDPKNKKTNDLLKKRLHDVLGTDIRATPVDAPASTTAETATFTESDTSASSENTQEDTDALSYFERLANE